MKYILALDQGTTSSRAIIFDKNGTSLFTSQKEIKQYYPMPGYVEHDAEEIWQAQLETARSVIKAAEISAHEIHAIGISNQRETVIIWDKNTGEPIHNAIVWQCRRTASYCEELKEKGYNNLIKNKTGLLLDPYFSATKIKWLLDNVSGAREKAKRGELLFGTVESWLIWRLTGRHVTDCSNASRTMLFNINTLEWDKDLLKLFEIPEHMLPQIIDWGKEQIETKPEIFGTSITISASAGDQQAALFGQQCFNKGDIKNTYGTGAFLLMNTGENPIFSSNGLLTTIAWLQYGKAVYALEGSVFIAGAVVQWLRDELGIISSADETEKIAQSVNNSNGVFVVPAFVGLGAPYWNSDARGVIVGLTRGANKSHIVRASLESIAFQTEEVIRAMERDAGFKIMSCKVDGGASVNNFLMQFQSDILNKPIERPITAETTALGVALMAGLNTRYWEDTQLLSDINGKYDVFEPCLNDADRDNLLLGWKKAVKAAADYK